VKPNHHLLLLLLAAAAGSAPVTPQGSLDLDRKLTCYVTSGRRCYSGWLAQLLLMLLLHC
jgi:hypothetical protein